MARTFQKKTFNEVRRSWIFSFEEAVADWLAKLSSVRDGCNPKDIANGDVMGLFFVHCEVRLGVQKVK
jgi:hypothetical protein